MSLALHVFMSENFLEGPYRQFLHNIQGLYGTWYLEELGPLNNDPDCLTIHEGWICSGDEPPHDRFRINIEACRRLQNVLIWDFEYGWHLRLETSTGRSAVGFSVQLGAWLLAMRTFRFNVAIDRDSSLMNEPTEFRSFGAATEHAKRLIRDKPAEWFSNLKNPILDGDGYLLLPPHADPP